MSRKSPTDQLADDIGCLVIGLLWLAIVGFFTLLFKSTQVSPEDQLLKLQPGYAWLWPIGAKNCPDCGVTNENTTQRCYRCGAKMTLPQAAEQGTTTAVSGAEGNEGVIIAIIILIAIGAVCALVMGGQGG